MRRGRPASGPPSKPRVLFVGALYAGHRTRFSNLRRHTSADPRILAEYRVITGWKEAGVLERLRFLPSSVRGRSRALVEGASLARIPRPDVIWTSAGDELLAPYVWAQLGPFRRPLVIDADATPGLLEDDAELYFDRPPKKGMARQLLDWRQRVAFANATWFMAWSRWAAAGLEREGIGAERIRIMPPGVDLDRWRFPARPPASPLRVLFVGADFDRKGGPLLVDVIRSRFHGRVELDIVTRASVEGSPGIRVHRADPNSTELMSLFAQANLFVLPTRADCFGIAVIEAMASGLPVVMCDAGAAREIVDQGRTGWVIAHEGEALAGVLEAAVGLPERLSAMGKMAREVAEQRYDGRRNDLEVVDLLLEAHRTRQDRANGQAE
jgi:glycosyltransferase involved in cell wall biosynthesis